MDHKRLVGVGFLVPGLLLDTAVLVRIWNLTSLQQDGALAALALHLLAVAFCLAGFFFLLPAPHRREPLVSFLLMSGACLPLPLVGPALFLGITIVLSRIKVVPKLQENYVFGDQKYLTSSDRYELNVKEGTRSVLEIINSPDKAARRKAIVAMRLVEPKKAIPILRRALQDSDDEVRIYAQGVLSKIIESLETSLKQAEMRKPREVDELLRLAEQYHEFIYLGLVGEESESVYLDKAIRSLRRARELEPYNQQVLLLLVKCHLKSKQIDAAKECLETLKAANPESEFTIPWEMEVLFYERDWEGLERLLTGLNTKRWANTKMRTLFNFWLPPATLPAKA